MSPRRRSARAAFLLATLTAIAGCASTGGRGMGTADVPGADAGQMVLVTTTGWDATSGHMQRFERAGNGAWHAVSGPVPVTVGRAGSAWGIGLHPAQPGQQKREGDGRAPAGVFALGTAFGYAPQVATALPYAGMQDSDWCIDVPASPLYNRIVDSRDLHANGDVRYKLGFVVEHNPLAVPGAGSCIFAHLWRQPGEATAGCTAMAEPAMQAALDWLDPARAPVFVLLPEAEHRRLRVAWNLPPAGVR